MNVDQDAARFFALLLLTAFILSFCFYMLAIKDPCETGPLWGLIGTMIGFWFEGPSMKNKK